MTQVIDTYASIIGRRSGKPQSEAFERAALRHLDALAGSRMPGTLTARDAAAYLARLEAESKSVATQRSYWKALVRFSAWLLRRRLSVRDFAADHLVRRERRDEPLPWATRAGARLVNRGKPQLRSWAEVQAYLGRALLDPDPARRVAACLPLLTNARSGEILNLRVAAVDLEARVATDDPAKEPTGQLHVRSDDCDDDPEDGWNVKSATGRRDLHIPGCLRADLVTLTTGREMGAYVFAQADGSPHARRWLYDLVQSVCVAAGVRVVNPHGLRGTWATVKAAMEGKTVAAIGDGLGHADDGKTAQQAYLGAPVQVPALYVVVRDGVEVARAANE